MKKMKRLLALVMAMAMVLGMALTVSAAPEDVTDDALPKSNITVTGLSAGVETNIKVYQFAKLQYDSETNAYSWAIEGWASNCVNLNTAGTAYEITDQAALKNAVPVSASYTAEKITDTSYTFKNVAIGGYVIIPADANAKYTPLFVVNTYDRTATPDSDGKIVATDVTAAAKSEDHQVVKTVDDAFQQIGEDVNYTVKVTFPMYKNASGTTLSKFVVKDTPEKGVKIDSETVKVTLGTEELGNSDVSINVSTAGVLTVDFLSPTLIKENEGKDVTITYTAEVTEVDYINNVSAESTTVEYEPDSVTGDTGSITITKVDAEKQTKTLSGAKFKVYDLGVSGAWDPENKGTPMTLVYVETLKAYRPVVDGEEGSDTVSVDENGVLKIVGLDEGTYHFEETKAPNGYSINEAGLDVTIAADTEDTINSLENVEAKFLDTKLASLPSTGGIGTTIFTVGGCIIMIAAAALYFASKRRTEEQ